MVLSECPLCAAVSREGQAARGGLGVRGRKKRGRAASLVEFLDPSRFSGDDAKIAAAHIQADHVTCPRCLSMCTHLPPRRVLLSHRPLRGHANSLRPRAAFETSLESRLQRCWLVEAHLGSRSRLAGINSVHSESFVGPHAASVVQSSSLKRQLPARKGQLNAEVFS